MADSQGQRQLVGAGIANVLRHMDTYIRVRYSRQRQSTQHLQTGDKDMAASRVLAHVGDFFHHVGHGAAFSGAHTMMAMWAGNADDSHCGFRSARNRIGLCSYSGLLRWYCSMPRINIRRMTDERERLSLFSYCSMICSSSCVS